LLLASRSGTGKGDMNYTKQNHTLIYLGYHHLALHLTMVMAVSITISEPDRDLTSIMSTGTTSVTWRLIAKLSKIEVTGLRTACRHLRLFNVFIQLLSIGKVIMLPSSRIEPL
jgi:hypothetical protein